MMPGIHKYKTISFRPSNFERKLIEERAYLSGMNKKDFLSKSIIYSNICLIGTKENVQRIVDRTEDMYISLIEMIRLLKSDHFLSSEVLSEYKEDIIALTITLVDILDGAAYLYEKTAPDGDENKRIQIEKMLYK